MPRRSPGRALTLPGGRSHPRGTARLRCSGRTAELGVQPRCGAAMNSLPVLSEQLLLRAHPASAGQARSVVARLARQAGFDEPSVDLLVLLTSEVVANAVIHGRSVVRLTVGVDGAVMRVEVGDDNSRHPLLQSHDVDALDGRGVRMLQSCTSSWGVRPDEIGKTVWFEVDRDRAAQSWGPVEH